MTEPQITSETWDDAEAKWKAYADGLTQSEMLARYPRLSRMKLHCAFCTLSAGKGCRIDDTNCPLEHSGGCCKGLCIRWQKNKTSANAQAVLRYIRTQRVKWNAQQYVLNYIRRKREAQQAKEKKMSRVKIELVGEEKLEGGVLWTDAPLGPARITDSAGSTFLHAGEVVVILETETDRHREILCPHFGSTLYKSLYDIRVLPLRRPVKLSFAD